MIGSMHVPRISEILGVATDAGVQVRCPGCSSMWTMDRAYIAARADRLSYECPNDSTVLAFVEWAGKGVTYGLPHGVDVAH